MVFSNLKRNLLLLSLVSLFLGVQAQAPAGYYNSTRGQSGKALKTAFSKVISGHKDIGYDGLWNAYKTTDRRSDGKVWDMYSNTTNFRFGTDQDRGKHSKEGDTYNREHSFPQSWFGKATPMRDDVFHVYPTDSYVNQCRGNLPYGETDRPTYTSNNGWSKIGKSCTPGYSGTVFEPNDEYKGDIARTYFYMATAYESRFSKFHAEMLAGNSYPCYKQWAITMLLRWAQEDPVSQKEIDRNNAAYKVQGNRNPYIDFPGLEQYVWGSKTSTAFDPDNYDSNVDPNPNPGPDPDPNPNPQPGTVARPTFNPAPGIVDKGTVVSISSSTPNATIHYSLNEGHEAVGQAPVQITIHAHTSISAYAMLDDRKSETVTAEYAIREDLPTGNNVYSLVTNATELISGQTVLIVGADKDGKTVAMGKMSSAYRYIAPVTVTGEKKIKTEVNGEDKPYAFIVTKEGNDWCFFNTLENKYLALKSNGNQLNTSEGSNETGSHWDISFDKDCHATLQSVRYRERYLNYNAGAHRFACYKQSSNQLPVFLYAQMTNTGIAELNTTARNGVSVFDLNGRLIRRSATAEEALQALPAGLYIVNGRKILVR